MELDDPPLVLPGDGSVATVGTFDGVHLGHREVLREIVRRARQSGRTGVLVTFEPHPLRVVRPQDAPPLLTTLAEKGPLLESTGLDLVCVLPFTTTLQRYPARQFVTEILLHQVGMRELVMGYDHGFGRGREGSAETLRELGRELGFGVDVVDAVQVDGSAVSSTRIRRLLEAGDVVAAAKLLGRPYSVRGVVEKGAQRGRELGFPTANVRVESEEKMVPRQGIYLAYGIFDGSRIPGLLHLGPRPTFEGAGPAFEIHLLDWTGDLYGRTIEVEFCAHLRDIEAYDSVEALVAQMHRDREHGMAILAGRSGSSACA